MAFMMLLIFIGGSVGDPLWCDQAAADDELMINLF
jgi:hypothetical protein